MVRDALDTLFYLDLPDGLPAAKLVAVAGWVASPAPVERVSVAGPAARPPADLALVERPDVRRAYPAMAHVAGFTGEVPADWLVDGAIELAYTTGGREFRFRRSWAAQIDPALKARKLDRIAPLLRADLPQTRSTEHFDFLTPELRTTYNIVDVDAVSSNSYDPVALGLICRFADGLILDAGAGFSRDYRANVVNFEIVPYPSTDVLGVGEELPFRDDSFDAIFTLAVLEHVKDPFRCAREIVRVLKPGGVLYAVVPFLQPYHGYPHHYYNMTHQGLANLFPGLRVTQQDVPRSGLPVWTLSWYLRSYCEGLPQEEREAFRNRRVADFLGDPVALLGESFVEKLPAQANLTLASTTMLLATKA